LWVQKLVLHHVSDT